MRDLRLERAVQTYFENQAGETHDEFEWKLADGTDMDQSALAVVYITH